MKIIVKNIFLLFGLCLLSIGYSVAQIPVGTWRTHFSYQNAKSILADGQKIYCMAENGLFYLDNEDGSVNRISKINGLSDAGNGAMALTPQGDLVIGYSNGNIDVVSEGNIINIKDLVSESNASDFGINHILAQESMTWLSTNGGLALLDNAKEEIKEVYGKIGPEGQQASIYKSVFWNDSVWIATNFGIARAANRPDVNLKDYHNWYYFDTADGLPVGVFYLAANKTHLIVGSDIWVYQYNVGKWAPFHYAPASAIQNMKTVDEQFVILENSVITICNDAAVISTITGSEILQPNDYIKTTNGTYIADGKNGLLRAANNQFQKLSPKGPASDEVQQLKYKGGKIFVLHGGYDAQMKTAYSKDGFSAFDEEAWYTASLDNIVDVTVTTPGNFSFASFTHGIVQWDGTNFSYTNAQTPGTALRPNSLGETQVAAIGYDDSNIVLINHNQPYPVVKWNGQDGWHSFVPFNTQASWAHKMVIAENGDIWMAVHPNKGGSIVVYNPESGITRSLGAGEDHGNLPAKEVNDMCLDKEGRIWVATQQGPAVFTNPGIALRQEGGQFYAINANRPIYEDGYFLYKQNITALTIDQGNRIWAATDQALWLYDEPSETVYQNFTISNSPLPSSAIRSLVIDDETGEVFIGTSRGVVSWRGSSTRAGEDFSMVKIFPNPVRPGYQGVVTISELMDDVTIKIADINGKLVYETRAFGGTATWNLKSDSGSVVSAGTYLVYTATDNGNEKFVGKIAIVP